MKSYVFFLRLTLGLSTRGTIKRFYFCSCFCFFLVSFQKQSMYTHTSSYVTYGGHLSWPSLPLPPSLLLVTFVTLGHDMTLCPPVSPIALLEDPFPVLFYLSISKYQMTPGPVMANL